MILLTVGINCCFQATVTVAGTTSAKKPIVWNYKLQKADLVLFTKPIVDKMVNLLSDSINDVSLLNEMNSNPNLRIYLQFYKIVQKHRKELGAYYDAFIAAPKYLLLSGGPTRMQELVNGVASMLISV